MKSRIFSLQGALTLAFVHLLLELWRSFLDFSYILPEYAGQSVNSMAAFAALYVVLFAAWLMGLSVARDGRRGGFITAIVIGALFWFGLDLATIFFYCPGGCSEAVFNIFTWASILVGGAGLAGLVANLRRAHSAGASSGAPA